MIRNALLITGAAAAIFTSAVLVADEWDKKTNITVNETILIPGRTLPPGKYVMKLMNSSSNRNIVQIFNENQTQLQATILAINNYRLEPKDKTVLQYWETPSGSPPALRAWFFPGDNYGQEFAYPKKLAEELARANNNAKVPYYEGAESPRAEELAALKVNDAAAAPAEPEHKEAESESKVAAAEPVAVPAPESPESEPPTVIAQNTPSPSVSPESNVSSSVAAQNDANSAANAQPSELPVTATPIPLIALLGVTLIGIAGMLSLRRA